MVVQEDSEPPRYTTDLSINDFEIGRALGRGKLGLVYCARHRELGYIVALKVMKKRELVEMQLEKNLGREITIQLQLYHINISRLYGYFYDRDNVYLIVEYAVDGELYHHLRAAKRFPDVLASYYIFQVTKALKYLHGKGIIHRDIKPENLLRDENHIIKLSDFGWLVRAKADNRRHTICGTLDYLPPEMVEKKDHNYQVDLWALGVLCYELLTGKPPFENVNRDITYKRIVRVDFRFPPLMDRDAIDLITQLCQKDPRRRLSLTQVLRHPWIYKHRPKWPRPMAGS